MKSCVSWVEVGALACGLFFFSGSAWSQTVVSEKPATGAPVPSAAAVGPAPASAASSAAAPSPAATQAAPQQPSAPAPAAIPPGYKLVPIEPPEASTRYDVQYPQRRGALPPGMELPYEEGQPIPQGYRLVKQTRRGLVIAGSIVTGVPWVFSVTAAVGADYDNHSGFLLVPGLGPWLMLAAGGGKDECSNTSSDYGSRSCERAALRSILVLDGLVQTAGAVMFVAGIAVPRKRLVRSDVTVAVLPNQLGRDAYGLSAVGTF